MNGPTNQPLHFKLDCFEGPFDLLFHLIEKNEINIYDIPIVMLTNQYMLYLSQYEYTSMDSMSEFVLMAATLLEIKSKMLLPVTKNEPEEDPRDALVQRLMEYKRFKEAAADFKNAQALAVNYVYRSTPVDLEAIGKACRTIQKDDVSKLLSNITLEDLYQAFTDVIKRRELKTDKIRAGFHAIPRDLFSVEDKMHMIRDLLVLYPEICFHLIFHSDATKEEMVVTFLALLEMMKQKEILVEQSASFAQIFIRRMACV